MNTNAETIYTLENDLKKFYHLLSEEDLLNGKKISSFYGDYAPSHKKEKELLNVFLNCGGHQLLMSHKNTSPDSIKPSVDKLVSEMVSTHKISQNVARALCTAYWNIIHNTTGTNLWECDTIDCVFTTKTPGLPTLKEYLSLKDSAIPLENILHKKEYSKDYQKTQTLKIPDHIQIICKDAFQDKSLDSFSKPITKLILPASLEYIEEEALAPFWLHLKEIEVPTESRYIYTDGFLIDTWTDTLLFARNSDTLSIPSTVKTIASKAIHVVKDLRISNSVQKIALNSLSNLALESIEVDQQNSSFASYNGVLYSADFASLIKYPCKKTELCCKLHPNTCHIEAMAFYKSTFESIILSDELETIGDMAFHNCANLKEIVLPPALTQIGSEAFSECTSLTQINLPESLNKIGDFAFAGCINLCVNADIDPNTLGQDVFIGCHPDSKVV